MKLTVIKNLNVRVGKPSLNAPCYQYLAPGSELEVDGKLYSGDRYDGNDQWYKDETGNYYWSGGVKKNESLPVSSNESDLWFQKLDIQDIWSDYNEKGKGCNVLVLDTGLNDELDVFDGVLFTKPFNFVTDSNTTKSIDEQRHGTHCAGLIASRNPSFNVGVAPESKLLVGKINERGSLKDADSIKLALSEFMKPEYDAVIDLISISQTVPLPDNQLHQLLNDHMNKGRVIVAAIGNDNFKSNLDTKKYPGFYEELISVGSCENDNSIAKYTCFPSAVDIFCYGTDIKSYKDETFPLPLTGTSQATAIVAGVCALIISFLKKKNASISNEVIKKILKENSSPCGQSNNYQLINPKAIFETINSI